MHDASSLLNYVSVLLRFCERTPFLNSVKLTLREVDSALSAENLELCGTSACSF